MITSATPLSQFLVEQARIGCELSSAEGRSLLASQAFPMWNALPEGVLKAQILSDLAVLVNLGPHELRNLWMQQYAAPRGANGNTGPSGPAGPMGSSSQGAERYANPNGVFKRAFSKARNRTGFKSDGPLVDHNTAPRGSLRQTRPGGANSLSVHECVVSVEHRAAKLIVSFAFSPWWCLHVA